MAAFKVTELNFEEEVLKSPKPVLLDFWASWCGPCQMLMPVIESLAQEIETVKICKVNVDEEPDLASKYGVMNIPTLILLKDGEVLEKSLGVKSKDDIIKMFQKHFELIENK